MNLAVPNSRCGRNSYNPVNRKHISRVAASPATAKCAEFCATNHYFVNHVADSVERTGWKVLKNHALAPETATASAFEVGSHFLNQTTVPNVSNTYGGNDRYSYE